MGRTITFYQFFKNRNDEAFGSIMQSFITTYFFTFGELPLDSIKVFGKGDQFLSTCAVVLIMFHAAVVVGLLSNVLLAMMNKTIDSGIDKAKTEALASYAQCILRLEESMNLNKAEAIELIHFKDYQELVKKMDAMAVKLDDVNRYSASLEEKLDALMDAIVKMKR